MFPVLGQTTCGPTGGGQLQHLHVSGGANVGVTLRECVKSINGFKFSRKGVVGQIFALLTLLLSVDLGVSARLYGAELHGAEVPHLALHVVRPLLQAGPALEPGKLLPVLGHYAAGGSEGQAGGSVAASSGQVEVLCQNENRFLKLKFSFDVIDV